MIELMTFSVPESSALPCSSAARTTTTLPRRGARRALLATGVAAAARAAVEEERAIEAIDDAERARGDIAIGGERKGLDRERR